MDTNHCNYDRQQYLRCTIRWGYYWAFWAAILWGIWYVPSTAVWYEQPFVTLDMRKPVLFLASAAILTAFNSCLVVVFQLLWLAVLGKLADFFRTLWRFGSISKWYFLAAIAGGMIANFGSYLAMGYVGAVFAAVAGLFYPVIGAVLARIWYHEKINRYASMGIAIIIFGSITIYIPVFISEFFNNGSSHWLGYLGGAMVALGWGIEGAIVGRVIDVTDPDCGVTIRYIAESLYWTLLILPALAYLTPVPIYSIVNQTLVSWKPLIYLAVAAISFAFCSVAWYKSFPLIGVGRGQAIGASYALFATVFTSLFTLKFPEWYFLISLILVMLGSFVMVLDSDRHPGQVRHILNLKKTKI